MKCLAWLSGYRLLAREQVLMLELPHVLSIDEFWRSAGGPNL